MRVQLTGDPQLFEVRAGAFLAARLECNVLVTVLGGVLAGRGAQRASTFAVVLDDDDEPVGAALRTPPQQMLASSMPVGAAAPLLTAWLARDPELNGVTATPATAQAIAAAWCARTGGASELTLRLALHALDTVHDPPRPASGTLRRARDDESALMVAWFGAFMRETGLGDKDDAEPMVAHRLAEPSLYVWEHGGEAVSLVGVNPPVEGVVRIGPVYTPPACRRRGYAGTAVAAASRLMLDTVADRCMLSTDLANPTSNKIYAEVGYRRFADWEEYRFTR